MEKGDARKGEQALGDVRSRLLAELAPNTSTLVFNRPPPNYHFYGRRDELASIVRSLERGASSSVTAVPICGMAAVGKTQIANRFFEQHAHEYGVAAWLHCATDDGVADLARLADELGLPTGEQPTPVRAEMARRWLRDASDPWLVVLDDIADQAHIWRCIDPQGPGKVLVTVRNKDAGFKEAIDVEVFKETEGAAYLLERSGRSDEEDAARALSEAVGHHPFALSLAGAFCDKKTSTMNLTDYLAMLDLPIRETEFGRQTEGFYAKTIASMWHSSIDAASAVAPASRAVLDIAAHLGPEPIPVRLFRQAAAERLLGANASDILISLTTLARFGLASVREDAFRIHRLLQRTIREDRPESGNHPGAINALELLAASFPEEPHPESWAQTTALVPHVFAAVGTLSVRPENAQTVAVLLNRTTRYLNVSDRGRTQTLGAASMAQDFLNRNLPNDDPEMLRADENLATAHFWAGDYEKSIAIEKDLVERHCRLIGIENWQADMTQLDDQTARRTTEALANLGDSYRAASHLEEAIQIMEAVVSIRDATLEPHDQFLYLARSSLAAIYLETGDRQRIRDAVALLESVENQRRDHMEKPEDDPRTHEARSRLATGYRLLGDTGRAVELHQLVLQKLTVLLPELHADISRARRELIVSLKADKRMDEALSEARLLVNELKTTLGNGHRETGECPTNCVGIRSRKEIDVVDNHKQVGSAGPG